MNATLETTPATTALDCGESEVPRRSPSSEALTLRPIHSREDNRRIGHAAARENHTPVRPTHVVERNGQVIGYFSLNQISILTGWLSKTDVSQPEARELMQQMEVEAAAAGLAILCTPCTKDCRMLPDMERLAYSRAQEVTLWIKAI